LGEVSVNYDNTSGGLYYKDTADKIVKVGPAEVGVIAPNSSPAGSTGNSNGEFWYDLNTSVLKIWTGSAWVSTSGPTTTYTDTFLTTATTPINLLSFTGGVRMGTLTVMLTDNATNVAWANITIAADTGVGSSVITTSGGTFGTFAVTDVTGSTVVQFTPSASLASVSAKYIYTASFGAQPTVL
jgi:hypothetical protein